MKASAWISIWILFVAMCAGVEPSAANKNDTVNMPVFKASGRPILSYAIGLEVQVNKERTKIVAVYISTVAPGSDAELAGLRPGDEIVKVNGQKVAGMDPKASPDGGLGKYFINQNPGEVLDLEIVTRHTRKVSLKAVKQPVFPP